VEAVDTVRKLIVQAALVAACLTLAAPSLAAPNPTRVPLVDQTGSNFRIADLAGTPVVVTFVATRCSDACPIANAVFSRLKSRLARDRARAMLLTVTLDPAFDSPFVMARTSHQYDADPSRWRFVSGTQGDVRALMKAYGVTAIPDKHGIPESHSSFVYVLDGKGHLAKTLLLSSNLVDEVSELLRGPNAIR
jgi:protein SCO1